MSPRPSLPRSLTESLAALARSFHSRGWMMATSGNVSAVVSRDPLRLAITATGMDKARLEHHQVVLIDDTAKVIDGRFRASAEALLHLAIVKSTGAGAVLHTHSVWSTVLSEVHSAQGGFWLEGYEMLKAFSGVSTHDRREWLPILANSQQMSELAAAVQQLLQAQPSIHGFLLRRHGLYTWGVDLPEAQRHLEALEFLQEVAGRTRGLQA